MRERIAVLSGALITTGFGVLLLLERRRPLRARTSPGAQRILRNGALALSSVVVVALLEIPAVFVASRIVERRRIGLLKRLPLSPVVERSLAVLAMDYTIYLWHRLTHQIPFLWRFHRVHHLDRDLDATTAMRFHGGEMLLSVPFRLLQVLAIGLDFRSYQLWQNIFVASVLFHHSNVRLPDSLEHLLAQVFLTPRLHGIHHSDTKRIRDSNWSSGPLSVWDRIHGTLRFAPPQEEITIGLRTHASDESIGRLLRMPFEPQEDEDG